MVGRHCLDPESEPGGRSRRDRQLGLMRSTNIQPSRVAGRRRQTFPAGLGVGTSITGGKSELPGQPTHEQVAADAAVENRRSGAQGPLRRLRGTLAPGSETDLTGSAMQTQPLRKRHDPLINGQSLLHG